MSGANQINICIACDDNYSKYAGVVMASVLYNAAKNDEITFYILDGGISEEQKNNIDLLKNIKNCSIKFIKIDEELFDDYKNIKTHSYISIAACYRLKLPSLLPDVKRVIYFDCDFIVNSSLKKLFNKDLGKYPIAGVLDLNKRMLKKNPSYINSGMLVMDLDLMRIQNSEDILLNWTKEHIDTIKTGDQEIINEALKGKIKVIEDEWNVQSSNFTNRSSYANNPKGIHFVSKNKPWHFGSFSYHRNLYFKYLQMTPWKMNEKELRRWTFDNQIISLFKYLKYRPLFLFRPRFYEALFKTYILPLFEYRKPVIKNNTFLIWEPCSKSHSEVLPGFAKYLLDLGYHVSVLCTPERIKEGLFSRFKDANLTINKMSKKQVRTFFVKNNLEDIEGLLVTTAGKLCDSVHYGDIYKHFNKDIDKKKILLVEHEACHSVDNGSWCDNLIMLRELNYKGVKCISVNPHYFGDVKITPKNTDVTNFITIGALKYKKKNCSLIIDSVQKLLDKGYKNFKITVVGKGHLDDLPLDLRQYFDIKGRLSFNKMYEELEKADFLLTAYNDKDPKHIRYNTSGTSGNFQLVYGFVKPCVIIESFASINGFNDSNSIIYKDDSYYVNALEKGINMSAIEYEVMQKNLSVLALNIYNNSKENLKYLIESNAGYSS